MERRLSKDLKEIESKLGMLSHRKFACESDAQSEMEKFNSKLRYHTILDLEITAKDEHSKRGRPKQNQECSKRHFLITGKIAEKKEFIERELRRKGRFLLATNELDSTNLKEEEILQEYKSQSDVEAYIPHRQRKILIF